MDRCDKCGSIDISARVHRRANPGRGKVVCIKCYTARGFKWEDVEQYKLK